MATKRSTRLTEQFIAFLKRWFKKIYLYPFGSRLGLPIAPAGVAILEQPFSSKYDRYGKRDKAKESKGQAALRKATTQRVLAVRHANAD